LAFTPCVLPMMPILSSIIVGEGASVGRLRGFVLSLTYSMGMALVYTAFGVAAGLLGHGLSAQLQNPWVLGSFALLMVVLSLSMFGFYELQVPAALQERLTRASQKQRTGKLVGVFVMGALSALIVGPCVAAPLAGALVYLSQTRDVVIGGSALFALAMGMSVPLLLIGLSAGTLLPRAGAWMGQVKRLFGVLMLAVAWWMVAPLLPSMINLGGWAVLGVGAGAALVLIGRPARALQLIGIGMIVFGAVEAVGAATGASNVLAPLAQVGGHHRHAAFQRIASVAQLDAALRAEPSRVVMLDFYADWCTSCKEMESSTLIDPIVVQKLDTMLLLQADVTANSGDNKALLKRFGLFGPPGILFFTQGSEIPGTRIIGYQDGPRFSASLARAAQGAGAQTLPQ
ncbi:MAG: protein-disulfide reductase DsbD, partial [Pseudomonadota bacterium]|nr:protein-disulfide reductase DsbD [Pseudomonadota bacterium]